MSRSVKKTVYPDGHEEHHEFGHWFVRDMSEEDNEQRTVLKDDRNQTWGILVFGFYLFAIAVYWMLNK